MWADAVLNENILQNKMAGTAEGRDNIFDNILFFICCVNFDKI